MIYSDDFKKYVESTGVAFDDTNKCVLERMYEDFLSQVIEDNRINKIAQMQLDKSFCDMAKRIDAFFTEHQKNNRSYYSGLDERHQFNGSSSVCFEGDFDLWDLIYAITQDNSCSTQS